jgi:hypothetical protein
MEKEKSREARKAKMKREGKEELDPFFKSLKSR